MKKYLFENRVIFLLMLVLFASACQEVFNVPECEKGQTATLKVTNKSGHIQKCVLNGANIFTLAVGETRERSIQTGIYFIEFTYNNGRVCCSEAFFEARACKTYSYSCSH